MTALRHVVYLPVLRGKTRGFDLLVGTRQLLIGFHEKGFGRLRAWVRLSKPPAVTILNTSAVRGFSGEALAASTSAGETGGAWLSSPQIWTHWCRRLASGLCSPGLSRASGLHLLPNYLGFLARKPGLLGPPYSPRQSQGWAFLCQWAVLRPASVPACQLPIRGPQFCYGSGALWQCSRLASQTAISTCSRRQLHTVCP